MEPSTLFSIWFRLCAYREGWLYLPFRLLLCRVQKKYGIYIAPSTRIGYSLNLGHPCGIIINHTAVIENNVNLSQYCSTGANEEAAVVIGDNVYRT